MRGDVLARASRFASIDCRVFLALFARFGFLVAKDLRATNAMISSTILPMSSAIDGRSFLVEACKNGSVKNEAYVINNFCRFDTCYGYKDEWSSNYFANY